MVGHYLYSLGGEGRGKGVGERKGVGKRKEEARGWGEEIGKLGAGGGGGGGEGGKGLRKQNRERVCQGKDLFPAGSQF